MEENKVSRTKKLVRLAGGLISGKNSKIGNGLALFLIILAGVADVFTLIPLVGDFVGPAFWVLVSIFLWYRGLGFLNTNRLATEIVSTVAELVPAVQELPTIITGMILVILFVRFQERKEELLHGGGGGDDDGNDDDEARFLESHFQPLYAEGVGRVRTEESGPRPALNSGGYSRPRGRGSMDNDEQALSA
jgi:hypothetical protein